MRTRQRGRAPAFGLKVDEGRRGSKKKHEFSPSFSVAHEQRGRRRNAARSLARPLASSPAFLRQEESKGKNKAIDSRSPPRSLSVLLQEKKTLPATSCGKVSRPLGGAARPILFFGGAQRERTSLL